MDPQILCGAKILINKYLGVGACAIFSILGVTLQLMLDRYGVMPLALELDHVCFQNFIVGLLVYTRPRPSLCIVCVVEHPYFIKIVKEK